MPYHQALPHVTHPQARLLCPWTNSTMPPPPYPMPYPSVWPRYGCGNPSYGLLPYGDAANASFNAYFWPIDTSNTAFGTSNISSDINHCFYYTASCLYICINHSYFINCTTSCSRWKFWGGQSYDNGLPIICKEIYWNCRSHEASSYCLQNIKGWFCQIWWRW